MNAGVPTTSRFIASLFALLTRRIRTFATGEVGEACRYLELTDDEERFVRRFVAEYSNGTPLPL